MAAADQSTSDLVWPEPGSTTTHRLLSASLRVLLRELPQMPAGRAGAFRADFLTVRSVWAELTKTNPGALAAAFRSPAVSVLVRSLRGAGADAAPELHRQLHAQFLVELGALGALPRRVALAHPPPEFFTLSGRRSYRLSPIRQVSFEGEAVFVHDNPVRPLAPEPPRIHSVEHGLLLSEIDSNPLALMEAHPDKDGNAIDLGGKTVEQWCGALREALALIEEHLPTLHGELTLLMRQLVPVGFDARTHLSASYQEAIGTMYLTLHPSELTMAEALIHEFSHNKLNAMSEQGSLLQNAFHPLVSSPVRPDPRPLHGVLLAVHAFLPVAALYRALEAGGHPLADDPSFGRRFQNIVAGNREATETLVEHAVATDLGRPLLQEIQRRTAEFEP
ncbi:MAG: HEXXH motif-containing putative peptide modification protein [Myxococcota bacterium]